MQREYLSESQADTLMQEMHSQSPINRQHHSRPADIRSYEFARETTHEAAPEGGLPFERLHQTLLSEVRTVLFEITRQRPAVKLKPLPALRFDELQASWQEPCLLYHAKLEPGGLPVVLVFDGALICGLVDLIFGGDGAPLKRARRKTLSHSEAQVAGKFMDRMFGVLNAGWAEVVPMQLQRQRLESQPQFANFLSEDCRVGGFEFAVTLGSHEAGLGIYYQMDMLQALESSCYPALSRTDAGHAATGTGQAWSHQLRHKLQSAQLELVAEFAEFQLSIADLISLQKGDIIPISSPRELTARIGDRAVFACGFGLSQGRHAVRIEQKLTGLSAWDDQQGGAQAPLDNQGKETGHD